MQNRSSIFSFDTLQELPLPSRSFCVAAATVLLSVVLVDGFRDALMVRDPTSRVACVIQYLRLQEGAKPRILFLGSSRTESCIDTETFAQECGMPGDKVLNLARPNMDPWHMFVVVRHAPEALADVETAFIELAPHSFNENYRNPVTRKVSKNPDEFNAWATYSERARIRNVRAQCKPFVDFVLPLSQRRALFDWLRVGNAILGRKTWQSDESSPIYHQDGEKAARLASDPRFEARNISRDHLNDYCFSNRQAAALRELLAFLHQYGIETVFFHPPVRAEYFDYAASDPRIQKEFEKFRSLARDLARDHRVIYWETLADCGLDTSAVVDYGHFSREGALQFTRRLHAAVDMPAQAAGERITIAGRK
jgi:hypothetical protein